MGKGSVVPSPEGDARRWFVVVLRALRTANARTNDNLVTILSEDPPGETVTLVVSKTNPITFLFIG